MDLPVNLSETPIGENCLSGGGEMGAMMRAFPWAQTALGLPGQWPAGLRTAVSICLNSRFPMLLWWGPELVMLYNDAYRPILGAKKHPGALGQHGRECWPEIWDIIGPMLDGVLNKGQATWSEDLLLILDRNAAPEECYFTFSYSPIRDDNGGAGGVFTAVTETTRRVISERRMETLQQLALNTRLVQTIEASGAAAVAALAGNPDDIPFALLYLWAADGQQLELTSAVGAGGAPASGEAPASPLRLALNPAGTDGRSADTYAPEAGAPAAGGLQPHPAAGPLAQAMEDGRPVLVDNLETAFPGLAVAVHGHRVRAALVQPVTRPTQGPPYGCLIVGLNPLRPFDEAYHSFLTLVAGQIAAAMASVQALEEERRRAESLAQLDRAKSEFFSNVSHEFRTPLTLMLGPIQEALARSESEMDAPGTSPAATAWIERATLELVCRNSMRLLKLVNTLLDFSRIEAGRMEAVYEPTDLAALTADLASVFRSAIEKAGLRLRVDCPPLPEPVYVDREMWEKIVLNLLSNAFKFTFAGEIAVRLQPAGAQVVLSVQDSGVGINAEEQQHLFERFYRGSKTRARTHEGSGIGLALVKELVRLHGGTVQVTSQPDQGSTFTVTLPTGKAHLPPDQINASRTLVSTALGAAPFVEEALRWLPEAEQAQTGLTNDVEGPDHPHPHQPARILVVDDNADMREYLARLLSAHWQVETAANGMAALEVIRARLPDLVLSDVMMPGLDGIELLQALRADPHTWEIPVILLSARAGEAARLQGVEAGADDYLIKPFSARELLARVEARLELKALRAAAEQRLTGVLRELERSNRELEDFAFIASHDLQEPLRKIQAFGNILRDQTENKLTPEELEYIERMRKAAARMSVMIKDLLEYSRVASHPRPATPVDLNEVAAAVLEDLEISLVRSHGQVQMGPLPSLPVDAMHLRQLFQNLIGNALKFHRAEAPPRVQVYAEDGPAGFVQIVVEDNGVGFSPEHVQRLFQPFQRLHGRKEFDGNGIGLAICRKIVECYDGKITAESRPGQGAKFILTLPRGVEEL